MRDFESVARAYAAVLRAEDGLYDAIASAFPVGARVEIPRGRGVLRGDVVGHSRLRPAELWVRLHSTGRLTWVSVLPTLRQVDDA